MISCSCLAFYTNPVSHQARLTRSTRELNSSLEWFDLSLPPPTRSFPPSSRFSLLSSPTSSVALQVDAGRVSTLSLRLLSSTAVPQFATHLADRFSPLSSSVQLHLIPLLASTASFCTSFTLTHRPRCSSHSPPAPFFSLSPPPSLPLPSSSEATAPTATTSVKVSPSSPRGSCPLPTSPR